MEAATIVQIISAVSNLIVTAAPIVIKAEQNAKPFAEAIVNMFKGSELTQADIDNLIAQANALSAQIQSSDFVPPQQADDV